MFKQLDFHIREKMIFKCTVLILFFTFFIINICIIVNVAVIIYKTVLFIFSCTNFRVFMFVAFNNVLIHRVSSKVAHEWAGFATSPQGV